MNIEKSIEALQIAVLEELNEAWDALYECFLYKRIDAVCGQRLPREIGRAILRHCRNEGLAEYGRGLFSEDGHVWGSGYRITPRGAEWFQSRALGTGECWTRDITGDHRMLECGEKIEAGDQFWDGMQWHGTILASYPVPDPHSESVMLYRRPISEGVPA